MTPAPPDGLTVVKTVWPSGVRSSRTGSFIRSVRRFAARSNFTIAQVRFGSKAVISCMAT
jgi:hypothetical protein